MAWLRLFREPFDPPDDEDLDTGRDPKKLTGWDNFRRAVRFWSRAGYVYAAYKGTQVRPWTGVS